jgi:hypothetical protein
MCAAHFSLLSNTLGNYGRPAMGQAHQLFRTAAAPPLTHPKELEVKVDGTGSRQDCF